MAFTRNEVRKILNEAGVSDENTETAVSKLVKLHIDVVDPLKGENESLESKVKNAEKLKNELESARSKLAEYEEADYKGKYEAEKTAREKSEKEYSDYKAEQDKKSVRAQKEAAFREILKDAGVPEKHYAKIIRYSDIDTLELDEKGKIKTAKDVLKSIKEEWGDHVETVTEIGAGTAKPPAGDSGKEYKSKADIMKIKDSAERQAAMKEAILNGSKEFG